MHCTALQTSLSLSQQYHKESRLVLAGDPLKKESQGQVENLPLCAHQVAMHHKPWHLDISKSENLCFRLGGSTWPPVVPRFNDDANLHAECRNTESMLVLLLSGFLDSDILRT